MADTRGKVNAREMLSVRETLMLGREIEGTLE